MTAARSRIARDALDEARCRAVDASVALDELTFSFLVPVDHPDLVHAVETIRDARRAIAEAADALGGR